MKGQATLFSKASDEWETPKWLFNRLNHEFRFTVDLAANEQNKLLPQFYTNFLNPSVHLFFDDRAFVNPPYSKIAEFIKKVYDEVQRKPYCLVACLIPARTDTRYWHDYVMKAKEIRFIKGRLKFANRTMNPLGEMSPAPFPSCVVIFDGFHNHPAISAILQHEPHICSHQPCDDCTACALEK